MRRLLVLVAVSALFGAAFAGDPGSLPNQKPEYGYCGPFVPLAAFSDHATGNTTVSFRVNDDGSVQDIAVMRSAGRSDLDQAAVACASTWRYTPATKDGKPVAMPWQQNITWYPPKPHTCSDKTANVEATGVTGLTFTIATSGHRENVQVVRSSGSATLDDLAVLCSRSWRYKPAMHDDKAVEALWSVDVQWGTPSLPVLIDGIDHPTCRTSAKPDELMGIDGHTQVSFLLVGGTMIDLRVAHSSGSEVLDRAALACVGHRQYRETVAVPFRAYRDTITIDWRHPRTDAPPAPNPTAM